MEEKKLNSRLNGTKNIVKTKNYITSTRLWDGLQMNEGRFIFLLLIISLSIVLGKSYINYGNTIKLQNNFEYIASSVSMFSNASNVFNLSHIPDVSQFNVKQLSAISEKFANISQYDYVASVTMLCFKTYGWLIRAAVCGLTMMGLSLYVIYKDSSIPGINPPSPFSFSKQRLSKAMGAQINYLIAILNGLLLFIYMCL
ncbi:uncharacterized protein LOC143422957 [Xylocopa sonorina]|uniref:uncharacterized protein LOC143422957 n=1 Tax=Xylocopa sonorina TaxID=1818115 RepID=UPI00403B16B9